MKTSRDIAQRAFDQGLPIILVDAENRENEGDLVIPASIATPQHINFMATEGKGLICVSISQATADRLALPLMPRRGIDPHGTAFTVSVDAAQGISTGISAQDRQRAVKILADPSSRPADLISPGHLFPLIADPGGLRARQGHTEASWALAEGTGYHGGAVICEILKQDGTMARMPDLFRLSQDWGLPLLTIESLVKEELYALS
jgi:3,4-dihydroxy 2-butanone 4-phosphate synthase/GTP cyclohydrolase II